MPTIKTTVKKVTTALNSVGMIMKPTTVPILENVLCEITSGKMNLTIDNLEVRSTVSIEVESDSDAVFCIPFAILSKMVKSLPEAPVEFVMEGTAAKIICGSSEFNLTTVDAAEFPNRSGFEPEDSIIMDSADFVEAIGKAIVFVDEGRADVLKHLFIKVGEKATTIVGINPHVGIEITLPYMGKAAEIVLLKSSVNYIKNSIISQEEIMLSWNDKSMCIKGEDVDLIITLSEGKIPDVDRLFNGIDKTSATIYATDKDGLLPALKRISVLSEKNCEAMLMSFTDEVLKMTMDNTAFGYGGKEEIPAKFEGEAIDIYFNSTQLKNMVAAHDGDFTMYLVGPKKSVLVESEGIRGLLQPVVSFPQ